MITECDIFAYKTMVWQCSTIKHEDLYQGNCANNT